MKKLTMLLFAICGSFTLLANTSDEKVAGDKSFLTPVLKQNKVPLEIQDRIVQQQKGISTAGWFLIMDIPCSDGTVNSVLLIAYTDANGDLRFLTINLTPECGIPQP